MKRILLMDDSPIVLEATRTALEVAGYDVVCANDLAQLSQARERGPTDLVLMDVQMPEAFGDDVALTLRHAYGIAAPIYLLSSLDESDLAERVTWAQIDGFISKHLGLDGIVDRVRHILPVDGPR
ncbi:MAG: response regulator receiver protein [Myxococcales bacterium]|nr:response regulator receiver protein [Myxococcales bacterium]